MTETMPRTFRQLIREYVDDVIRLATLAALCGFAFASMKGAGSGWYVAPFFVVILTIALFATMNFAILEYLGERYTNKSPGIVFVVVAIGLNGLASLSVFYVVMAVVVKAINGAEPLH